MTWCDVFNEVQQPGVGNRHVVILGAGCSRAALPDGDANGLCLPLMQDFVQTVTPLRDLLEKNGISFEKLNFEEIYSDLAETDSREVLDAAKTIIYDYFSSLVLPAQPTLYDHLLVSLRKKDVVATFNWDPFLIQAVNRNPILYTSGPQLIFLHGNVMAGFCAKHSNQGPVGNSCLVCGDALKKSKLLYPIRRKNYDDDPLIAASWKQLRSDLAESFMITIFGYGAPASDFAAVELLKEGLGAHRELNTIEIIDTKPREQLYDTWEPFIQVHNHHYKIHANFEQSWIARHPGRTREAYIRQYLNGEWLSDERIPAGAGFSDLQRWASRLIESE